MAVGNPFGQPLFNRLGIGPGFAPSVVKTGNERVVPAAVESEPMFRQPGDMGRYVAFNDPGQPGEGFSNYQEFLAAGNAPAAGPNISSLTLAGSPNDLRPTGPGMAPANLSSLSALNPNRPTTGVGNFPLPPPIDSTPRPSAGTFNLDANSSGISPTGAGAHLLGPGPGQPGGITNVLGNPGPINMNAPMQRPPSLTSTTRPSLFSMFNSGLNSIAFPSLAPSRPSTFTGAFGGNNPMNNNPMSGGTNSNQPLSQQIPQAVQQAVTPLLQNTATQLNQGIGSMVNDKLIGGANTLATTGTGFLPQPRPFSLVR